MQPIANANSKIEEATYFLRLMNRVEKHGANLLEGHDRLTEFSFLYSAFLNSCYSAVRQLGGNDEIKSLAKLFLQSHPDYYKSGPNGGARTKSVYFKPLKPGHEGYLPPPGDNVILAFDSEPYVPPSGKSVNLNLSSHGRFYENSSGPQNAISDLAAVHLSKIRALVKRCELETKPDDGKSSDILRP